ncbi:MAG: class I SAM-dependent methyltransferase [Candidatus Dormibacteraceae bacterium]
MTAGAGADWDAIYAQGETTRSWFQVEPVPSLRMLDRVGVSPEHGVIDVGGGASTLVDALLRRGFGDLTVLDISATGLRLAQDRLGAAAAGVRWIVADLLDWQPSRTYAVWHDRALFHFLTARPAQDRYLETLRAATAPGSVAIVGCFALDGPPSCSGRSVARYDAPGLAEQLGAGWSPLQEDRLEHATPAGASQPFTWAAFRRT